MAKGYFSVAQLFAVPPCGTRIALFQHLTTIDTVIAQKIAHDLDLAFLPMNEPENLCFAYNNSGLRSEYKQSFVATDLADYIYGILKLQNNLQEGEEFLNVDTLNIPFPEHAAYFWECVALGGEIRKTFYRILP